MRGVIGRLPIYTPELLYCTALLSTHEQARAPTQHLYPLLLYPVHLRHAAQSFFFTPHLIPRFIVFLSERIKYSFDIIYFHLERYPGEYYIL